METLEALRRRIESAEDLRSVVRTMKTLAAVSIQRFQEAVRSLTQYHRTIEMGLQIILKSRADEMQIAQSEATDRLGAIIIGSDQGMCGQFNEQIVTHALREMDELGVEHDDRLVLAVGLRVVPLLEEAREPVAESFSIPASLSGITPMVQRMLLTIEQWHSQRDLDRFVLCYNRPLSSASHLPHTLQVLPIDPDWRQSLAANPWPGRTLPTFTMDWDRLFTSLIHQYLLISLYRAVVESLASENASRLASMQAAENNIEERLTELDASYHYQRQSSITEELLDILGGFEALRGEAG